MSQIERLFDKYAIDDGFMTRVRIVTESNFQLALEEALLEQREECAGEYSRVACGNVLAEEFHRTFDAVLNAKVTE